MQQCSSTVHSSGDLAQVEFLGCVAQLDLEGGWLAGGAASTPTPRIDPLPWATGVGTGMAPSVQQGEVSLLLEEHGPDGGYQVERL